MQNDTTLKPYTRLLVRFALEHFKKGFPADVEQKTKELLVDQIGLQLGCSEFPWSKSVFRYTQHSRSLGSSTIFNYGTKVSAETAAFVNATFGHAQDFDDTCLLVQTHPSAVIVPVGIAMGEEVGASGREVLNAISCGLEVMLRVAHSVSPGCLQRGHHTPQATGPFGAAITAGLLLGLDEEQLLHAVAVAGSFSGGLIEYTQSGGSTKRIHCAIPTTAGIRAAYFALEGITGPTEVLEGKKGFCRVYTDTLDLNRLDADLGSKFLISHVDLKKYNCCYFIHNSLEATLELVKEHGLKPSEIRQIRVGNCRHALTHVGRIRKPTDSLGAQFSTAFVLAYSLLRELPGLHSYEDDILKDPELLAFTDKVEVYEDEIAQSEYPKTWGSLVTIEMNDGRRFEQRNRNAKGSIGNPLTEAELLEKFFRNLEHADFSRPHAQDIVKSLFNLEGLATIRQLSAKLRKMPRQKNPSLLNDVSLFIQRTAPGWMRTGASLERIRN